MNPKAIPISPADSHAVLNREAFESLFGIEHKRTGSEKVEVVQTGTRRSVVDAILGDVNTLLLSGADLLKMNGQHCVLRGSRGHLKLQKIEPIPSILYIPKLLMDAWKLADDHIQTFALNEIAIQAAVAASDSLELTVDRSLVASAGFPETAAWLPQISWKASAPSNPTSPTPDNGLSKRVITENDVRKARMTRGIIEVSDKHIVTPAARVLGEELGIFQFVSSTGDK